MPIRLKSTEKTPACVSMRAFLQPISARIYFGKTALHRKRARFVQSRGASPQAYWMSVKAAQRWGCAKRTFCGVCFLMPGGLKRGFFIARFLPRCRGGRLCPPRVAAHFPPGRCGHRPQRIHPPVMRCRGRRPRRPASAKRCHSEPVTVSLAWESVSAPLGLNRLSSSSAYSQ